MSTDELRDLIDNTVRLFGIAFVVDGQVLDPSQVVIHGATAVTEYGHLMSGGGVHVRNPHPEVEGAGRDTGERGNDPLNPQVSYI